MSALQRGIAAGVCALTLAACGSSSGTASRSPTTTPTTATTSGPQPAGQPPSGTVGPGSAYDPPIDPADFQATVDNPWFPLEPGSSYVYTGVKDGTPARDVYRVTRSTQTIDGVPCVIVDDRLYLAGHLEEKTSDYYTQDKQGNVWYFGERTAELDPTGKVTSTEGSWLAGVRGAKPGLFMEANPVVGHAYRQEYDRGNAEDQFRVASLTEPVTVPLGHFTDALLTEETTAIEPGTLDHKVYVKGIGEVAEITVKGPPERALLVSYRKG
ncbi:hypothetical protein [Aquihabitans sp. McL0605]|uniref:hypothetical protein n=1 Tax=Aquihabitans sp. McL0605 TaxID=3415671 RepID=UPI003CF1D561